MGSLYSLCLLALMLVTFVDQIRGSEVKNETDFWFVEGNKTSERAFEGELEHLLRSILSNGIPGLNITTLDPFDYEDNISISETDISGMMTIEYFELGDFTIDGLSSFVVNFLEFTIYPIKIDFNFTFPLEVKANHSNFSIIVGDLLPLNGEGPATLNTELRVEGSISLGISNESYLILDALTADIFLDNLEVEFSTVMGVTGNKEAHIFNKLIGDVTPELIDLMKPYVIDEILDSLVTLAKDFISSLKITLNDIVACLIGGSDCPFDLL